MKEILLYHLFESIRSDKRLVTAGTGEFLLLQEFLNIEQQIHPVNTFDELVFVCEKLWLKNKSEEPVFREIFRKWRTEIEKYILAQQDLLTQPEKKGQLKQSQQEKAAINDLQKEQSAEPVKPVAPPIAPTPNDQPGEDTNSNNNNSTGLSSHDDKTEGDLSFSIGSENTSAETVTRAVSPDYQPATEASSKTFLFGDEYFPVANRYLRQNWRNLKSSQEVKEFDAIDFISTTNNIARTGFFTAFEYEKRIENLVSLFIFIDHGGSMDACEAFGNELAKSAWQSELHANTTPYYFYNLPEKNGWDESADYIFFNEEKTMTYTAGNLFGNGNKKNIVTLIYSDAGAFRGTRDETTVERVKETAAFLRYLLKRTANTAWINPAPKARWQNTAAEGISQAFAEVPMFEATATGIDQAVNALKGKMSVYH